MEGEAGYFRRNHLVPVPKVKDLAALNEYLRTCCQQEEQRRIHGKPLSVGETMGIEREYLLPLLGEGFELAETSFPVVDGQGCVKVRTNRYSVPLRAGAKTQARLLPAYVEVWYEQRCVARHERRACMPLKRSISCSARLLLPWADRMRTASSTQEPSPQVTSSLRL